MIYPRIEKKIQIAQYTVSGLFHDCLLKFLPGSSNTGSAIGPPKDCQYYQATACVLPKNTYNIDDSNVTLENCFLLESSVRQFACSSWPVDFLLCFISCKNYKMKYHHRLHFGRKCYKSWKYLDKRHEVLPAVMFLPIVPIFSHRALSKWTLTLKTRLVHWLLKQQMHYFMLTFFPLRNRS